MKKLISALSVLLLLVKPVNAANITFDIQDPNTVYSISSKELNMQVVIKCYSGLHFSGNTKIKYINLDENTQTTTMYWSDDTGCTSYKLLGVGVNVSASWLNLPKTGSLVFEQSLSFATQYYGEAYNAAYTQTWTSNSQVVQTIDRGELPTIVYNTNNWSRRADAGSWLNNGFPSQFDTNILSADVVPIHHNDSTKHQDGSSDIWALSTDTVNVTLTGMGVNIYNGGSPWQNNKLSIFIGDRYDLGYSILDVDAAWNNRFIISKGQLMVAPYDAFTDTQQNNILREISNKLNNISTANVVTAINNQTTQEQTIATQQEQAAQQRQEEIMNDDTSQAETQMADFMTSFDAGEDQTLSSVITAPIRLAAALQGLTCTPLQLPLPIVNTNLVLPCPRQKLQQAFPQIILLWDGITTGLIAYGLAVHLFQIMQKAKNPDDVGKVEIFEL